LGAGRQRMVLECMDKSQSFASYTSSPSVRATIVSREIYGRRKRPREQSPTRNPLRSATIFNFFIAVRSRTRHWQSPGRYHKKNFPTAPLVSVTRTLPQRWTARGRTTARACSRVCLCPSWPPPRVVPSPAWTARRRSDTRSEKSLSLAPRTIAATRTRARTCTAMKELRIVIQANCRTHRPIKQIRRFRDPIDRQNKDRVKGLRVLTDGLNRGT
jgi:hypothetical protein